MFRAPFSRTLALASLLSLLSGCSTLVGPQDPLADATAVYSYEVRGSVAFRCDYDASGPYWHYEGIAGALLNDKGIRRAVLETNAGITHADGSHLEAEIVETRRERGPGNLPDALFKATAPEKGALRDIRWIERRNARGGMPLTRCSASQRGSRLSVPFQARYILYR